MKHYWFAVWLREHRVVDETSLRRALGLPRTLDSLLEAAPSPTVHSREEPSDRVELTGGKGIDLTGELGCRHINCLSKEIDALFRHAWHYFDIIRLPDQALYCIVEFRSHRNVESLASSLLPFIQVLRLIEKAGGQELVRFDVRTPSCCHHLEDHARDAEIDHAFANTTSLVREIAASAKITRTERENDGHRHLEYRLDHPGFEHSEWGSLCEQNEHIPERDSLQRESIAMDVVRKYLAGLSADALAARRTRTPLGATIPLYRRLLATHPSQDIEDIAFELALPISPDIPIALLMKLRRTEGESFQRFRTALTTAISERVKNAGSDKATAFAREIKRDVIEPELRSIRDKLAASRKFAARSAATGVGLGVIAATVGLLSPLSAIPISVAIGLGASALKKANDDLLLTEKEVSLSDMYFLWKAHQH